MSESAAWAAFRRFVRVALAAAVAFNVVVVSIRFLDGIPLGVDSTSHLFKIMLMTKSYQQTGYLPRWNPYWYGGTPLSLLYPPLSYYITFALSLAGLGPIFAYKLVDVLFYLLGPVVIFYLSRSLGCGKEEGILAAFLFSFSPSVVENFLFYDRFPSIVSLPVVCLFLIVLHHALTRRRAWSLVVVSGVLFGTIVLLHHLSALCAALLGLLLAASEVLTYRQERTWTRCVAPLAIVFLIGSALSSFWLVPFAASSSRFLSNPFYNRNVEFPFIRLTYFSLNVVTYAFGVAHLVLSVLVIWLRSTDCSLRRFFVPATFATMVSGMAMFELGEKFTVGGVRIVGQMVVVFSLLTLLWVVARGHSTSCGADFSLTFLSLWFVIFFWLSLGNLAIPLVAIAPLSVLWRAMDVHRFWLYLCVSMSILSAVELKRLSVGHIRLRRLKSWPMPLLLMGIVVAGGFVKMTYATTHDVSEFLPYSLMNENVPNGLITYFRSDPTYGRVLAVRCPLWTYVLPYYVDRPLVDGWYPQEKLVKSVLEINDYRILDLESAGPVEPVESPNRTRIWRDLILNSRLLAIKWVIVGRVKEETKLELFNETHFRLDAQIPYEEGTIAVYRSSEDIEMTELTPSDAGKAEFIRNGSDILTIRFSDVHGTPILVVKEAYFPTWRATSDGIPIAVQGNSEGFITIRLPEGVKEIVLSHEPVDQRTYYMSLVVFATSLLFVGACFARRRLVRRRHAC